MAAVMIGWSPAAFAAPLLTSPYQSLPESRIPAAAVAGAMGMHFGGAMGTAVIMIPLVWVNELMGVR
ncbi:MAG: hypothetical protein IRZ07_12835, partial [Microbispora sp.]|nr:hypothetical protein [Microbispora sp.]